METGVGMGMRIWRGVGTMMKMRLGKRNSMEMLLMLVLSRLTNMGKVWGTGVAVML